VRLKLIACEVLYREMCALAARSPHQVDVAFLPKALHDMGSRRMCGRLQEVVDAVDGSRYDALALGYALCGNGVVGLRARSIPLVIPRGHDCITLFLGSRRRYQDYFDGHPGVYFKTTGWMERGEGALLEELKARYGEENAEYLYRELRQPAHYRQMTFIEMGVEPGPQFEQRARRQAEENGWEFEKMAGDLSLLKRLVEGEWNSEEFLQVPPGGRIAATFDDRLIAVEADPE
jgi:hypothetical protein